MKVTTPRIPVYQANVSPTRARPGQHFIDANDNRSYDTFSREQQYQPETLGGRFTGRFHSTGFETKKEPLFPKGFIQALQTEPRDYSQEDLEGIKVEQSVNSAGYQSSKSMTIDKFVKEASGGTADQWVLRVGTDSAQIIGYKSPGALA